MNELYPRPRANYLPGGRKFEQWRSDLIEKADKEASVFSGSRAEQWRNIDLEDPDIEKAAIEFFETDPRNGSWEKSKDNLSKDRTNIRYEKLEREIDQANEVIREARKKPEQKKKETKDGEEAIEAEESVSGEKDKSGEEWLTNLTHSKIKSLSDHFQKAMAEARALDYPTSGNRSSFYSNVSDISFMQFINGEIGREGLDLAAEAQAAHLKSTLGGKNIDKVGDALRRLSDIEYYRGNQEVNNWATQAAEDIAEEKIQPVDLAADLASIYPWLKYTPSTPKGEPTPTVVENPNLSNPLPINDLANGPAQAASQGQSYIVNSPSADVWLSTLGPSHDPLSYLGRERLESAFAGREIISIGSKNVFMGDNAIAHSQFQLERTGGNQYRVTRPISPTEVDQTYWPDLRKLEVDYGGERYQPIPGDRPDREVLLPAGSTFTTYFNGKKVDFFVPDTDQFSGGVSIIDEAISNYSPRDKAAAIARGESFSYEITSDVTRNGSVPLIKVTYNPIPENHSYIRKEVNGVMMDYRVGHHDEVYAAPGDHIVVKVNEDIHGVPDREVIFPLPGFNDGLRKQVFSTPLGDMSIAEIERQTKKVWRDLRNAGVVIQPANFDSQLGRALRSSYAGQSYVEGAAEASKGFMLNKVSLDKVDPLFHKQYRVFNTALDNTRVWKHVAAKDIVEMLGKKGYQVVLEPVHHGEKRIVAIDQGAKRFIVGPDTRWNHFIPEARKAYVEASLDGFKNVDISKLESGAFTVPTHFSALKGTSGFDALRVIASEPKNGPLSNGLRSYFDRNEESFHSFVRRVIWTLE